ncbi:hypothetical protein N7925_22885 [Streptomyces sp. CA-278952]|uniref:hypothetical protein n=1 Tax=Streptomyces sp. CA-278952 TaxID=2980556 RepID=UPI002368A3F8|nr:hypothetical protein [Streptomyces sp. CA-278952]WDG33634.1 hypothetical protein N7925_22885 [Streptomyces sp. CA-278952]
MAVTAPAVAVAVAAMGLAASPAAASPAAAVPTATAAPQLGGACTAADLGTRHPYIKNTEVSPTITHFKGWYVTEGTTGNHTVVTSTETVITVSVGLTGGVEGSFAVATLEAAKASLGLEVKVGYASTSSESNTVVWSFNQPGYYGVYKGTKKVTGTYGSLNCNRSQQSDGSWALKWAEGPGGGSFTTYTTLEEGAVRCQDTVPAGSIMAKAQGLLDCGSPAAKAEHPAGAVAPTAKQEQEQDRKQGQEQDEKQGQEQDKEQDRLAQPPARTSGTSAAQPGATGRGARAALDCQTQVYKIAVPGKPLSWGAPLLADDGVRLRPSTIFSAHLDHWRLCNVTESNGVIEATLWNWGNGGCATIAAPDAATDRAVLRTAACAEDDLQRFYVYRDVPGSSKIGVQNKYTGSMMGHDRYADGEFIRQYSSGRQDGTGTYSLTGV